MASLPTTIVIKCPTCGESMPPVPVQTEERYEDGVLTLGVSPRMDDEWWATVRETHPDCTAAEKR